MTKSTEETTDKGSSLTPTEYLVMEVLTARFRLGEHHWSFPNRVLPSLRSLEAKRLISFKGNIIAGHQSAWLTLDGKHMFVSPTYKLPAERNPEDTDAQ